MPDCNGHNGVHCFKSRWLLCVPQIVQFGVEVSDLLYVFGADFLLNTLLQFIINQLDFVVDFFELATEFVNTGMDFLL